MTSSFLVTNHYYFSLDIHVADVVMEENHKKEEEEQFNIGAADKLDVNAFPGDSQDDSYFDNEETEELTPLNAQVAESPKSLTTIDLLMRPKLVKDEVFILNRESAPKKKSRAPVAPLQRTPGSWLYHSVRFF